MYVYIYIRRYTPMMSSYFKQYMSRLEVDILARQVCHMTAGTHSGLGLPWHATATKWTN